LRQLHDYLLSTETFVDKGWNGMTIALQSIFTPDLQMGIFIAEFQEVGTRNHLQPLTPPNLIVQGHGRLCSPDPYMHWLIDSISQDYACFKHPFPACNILIQENYKKMAVGNPVWLLIG